MRSGSRMGNEHGIDAMPLVAFRPTKARLVIEDNRDSVLVMKVVLDPDDAVELATGGTLAMMAGVLRIRERREAPANGRKPIGTLAYVPDDSGQGGPPSAKFQVNVTMGSDKFGMLLRAANAGRLPAKFIVDAGASTCAANCRRWVTARVPARG